MIQNHLRTHFQIILLPLHPKGNLLIKHVSRECVSQDLCPKLLSCNVCRQSWWSECSLPVSVKATKINKALLCILFKLTWLTQTETELGSANRQPCRPTRRAGGKWKAAWGCLRTSTVICGVHAWEQVVLWLSLSGNVQFTPALWLSPLPVRYSQRFNYLVKIGGRGGK